jgi:hypothetical protein
MGALRYTLPGDASYVEQLYPDPAKLDPSVGLKTYEQVIARFTGVSLAQDGIAITEPAPLVTRDGDGYHVAFTPAAGHEADAKAFSRAHVAFLARDRAGLALAGAAACRATPAWNPMAGFPVNRSDGNSEWIPCLPLGLPLVNQRAVVLMHYPPIVAYRNADYLDNNTLRRWALLLGCVGVDAPERYHSIVDVNPIAAPGSGESEYQDDYFTVSLTSQFYDDDARGLTYVRAMLAGALDPPSNAGNPYTLPLLVCGSPLYDPQAAAWFRVRYKDQLPKDAYGSPTVDVLQAGLVRLEPSSPKLTPYMVANHMIAAGVTGECTSDPSKIPDIRKYEAQDLVAATFLSLYHERPDIDPAEAKRIACRRWFGADDGSGAPNPPAAEDRLTICALAQVDLCFDVKTLRPTYTFDEAKARCERAGGPSFTPCFGCAPIPPAAPLP